MAEVGIQWANRDYDGLPLQSPLDSGFRRNDGVSAILDSRLRVNDGVSAILDSRLRGNDVVSPLFA